MLSARDIKIGGQGGIKRWEPETSLEDLVMEEMKMRGKPMRRCGALD